MAGHRHLHADEHLSGAADQLAVVDLYVDGTKVDLGDVLKVVDDGEGGKELGFAPDASDLRVISAASAALCLAELDAGESAVWLDTSGNNEAHFVHCKSTGRIWGVQITEIFSNV